MHIGSLGGKVPVTLILRSIETASYSYSHKTKLELLLWYSCNLAFVLLL